MNTACPFCCSGRANVIQEIISLYNHKPYQLIECPHWGLQFFIPLVFENVYETEMLEEYARFHQGKRTLPPWTKEVIRVIKALEIGLENKTILEIGAGDGVNYQALQTIADITPANYYAIELDSKSIEQCRLRGITNIIEAKFDEIPASRIRKQFDVILLLEVLEHQTNPKEFLDLVYRLLNQDGMIILTVPNRERYFLRYDEFQGDLPPHHFLRFNTRFFQKNFDNHLYYLKDFKHRYTVKNTKTAARKLASRFHLTEQGWIVFYPLVPLIHWIVGLLASIKGEGIVAILKK